MFQILIVPNNSTANLALSYLTKEKALEIYEFLSSNVGPIHIDDDFGYKILIGSTSISYILFVDVEQSQHVQFEKDMATNRAREKIQHKLDKMGFKAQQPQQKPRIIQ